MASLEVALKAVNEAGRTKTVVFEAEYGTDEEAFQVFASIYAAAGQASMETVAEQHGWDMPGKGKGNKPA